MDPHVRAAVASVALAHHGGQSRSSVYSYGDGQHYSISVTINGASVNAYDYTSGCHVTGTLPSLYHYGVGAHITLTPSGGGNYSGYDYASGSNFTLSVNGGSAQVYDYGASGHFSYS